MEKSERASTQIWQIDIAPPILLQTTVSLKAWKHGQANLEKNKAIL